LRAVVPPQRIQDNDEPRPVAHQHLDPDLVDQLANARHDLIRPDRGSPGCFDVGVAGPGSCRFEHRIADQGDRLRRVERQSSG